MNKVLFAIILALVCSNAFCQAAPANAFNESSYVEIARGVDPDNTYQRFVIRLRHAQDTSYTYKKMYLDSSYSQLASKIFYKDALPEGPFSLYVGGSLVQEGTNQNGTPVGERKTYRNSQLVQKAQFTNGKKTGIWEEYNGVGAVIRRTTYDNSGNLISDQRY